MDSEVPNFSLNFDEFEDELGNSDDNELLAAIDTEETVTGSTNNNNPAEQRNVNNEPGKSTGEKTRFAELSSEQVDNIISKSAVKHTKENTKWGVRVFEAWYQEKGIKRRPHEMNNEELDSKLRYFYAEARTKDGKLYSRSSLLCFRNAIERHLNNPPFNRGINIGMSNDFQQSNQLPQSQIKLNKRENKETTKHKPPIPRGDLLKLQNSNVIRGDHPWGLLRNVWFHINLYWCRRGREGQRALTAQSFQFLTDDNGREYAAMTHDEATKNHPGGLTDRDSMEKEARMYSTADDPLLDGLKCLKRYISKLNPKNGAFFQYPRRSDSGKLDEQQVWYENRPLGLNRLGNMMKEISTMAGLSKQYTNHCVRATAITLWSEAEVPTRHIMAISGHRNEASLRSYNARPSSNQLQACSDILTSARNETSHSAGSDGGSSHMQRSSTSSSTQLNVQHNALGGAGLFSSCTIESVQVFINSRSSEFH